MLTLPKIGRFLLDDSFLWETSFLGSPLLFEHEQLHDGHGSNLEDDFGMGDVKVAGSSVREHHIAEHQRCLYGGLIQVGRLSFG